MATINLLEKFFKFDEDAKAYKCQVERCKSKPIQGVPSTVKRHLVDVHPRVAQEAGVTGYKRKAKVDHPDTAQTKKLKSVTLTVDPEEFERGLLEMVAVNSVSLNYFDSASYKNTAGVLAKALSLPTNADAMGHEIASIAATIRELISEELQNTMFSLKFDGASRHDRKIIGVNAQFKRNGKTIIRTLSMREINEKQTGANLRKHVDGVLEKYKTKITRVYAVNTDRAPNVISCSRQLRMEQNIALLPELPEASGSLGQGSGSQGQGSGSQGQGSGSQGQGSGSQGQGSGSQGQGSGSQGQESPVPAHVLDNSLVSHHDQLELDNNDSDDEDADASKIAQLDQDIDEMLKDLEDMYRPDEPACLDVLKCGSHVLNSIFKDALNSVDSTWLSEVRQVVKASKRIEYRRLFKMARTALPKIDIETRWASTYRMVKSIIDYKEFYLVIGEQYECLKITETSWKAMEEFFTAFATINIATTAFQNPNLIMGDMLKIIKRCQFDIGELKEENRFVPGLSAALEERSKSLLESKAFKAALLFDPRWCFFGSKPFDKDEKLVAIDHVLKLAKILKQEKNAGKTGQTSDAAASPQAPEPEEKLQSPQQPVDPDDAFEASLRKECSVPTTSACADEVNLKLKLINLSNRMERLPVSTDIVKYWETIKNDDPELYELAQIALSAPVTQTSVERCFSAVKLLLENHRLRMSQDRLDDLMIIRCNKELLPYAIEKLRTTSR